MPSKPSYFLNPLFLGRRTETRFSAFRELEVWVPEIGDLSGPVRLRVHRSQSGRG